MVAREEKKRWVNEIVEQIQKMHLKITLKRMHGTESCVGAQEDVGGRYDLINL